MFSQEILFSQEINNYVSQKIDSMRKVYNYPSVAYGVIRNDSILVMNVVGYRDIDNKDRAQPQDHYHIGSNTKAFTGFLAGKLVEEHLLDWDTKFFELYPELKKESNPAYYDMTLRQLLSHRARMINFNQNSEVYPIIDNYEKEIKDTLCPAKKRYFLIKEILKHAPLPPYDQNENNYSNAGIIAASLMLEKATGRAWEDLMIQLSNDLNLDIHIGWPNELGVNQPKGHINPKYWQIDSKTDLIPLPEILKMYHYNHQYILLTRPSGDISITLKGFLTFLRLNINGLKGENNYLKSSTYKEMFTSFPKYTIGWWVESDSLGMKYTHRGSNGTFYSFAGFSDSSKPKLGIVVMINSYKEEGMTDIIDFLLTNYAEYRGQKVEGGIPK
jgi:CubicO group peptidase (beta-lactamase class C family)